MILVPTTISPSSTTDTVHLERLRDLPVHDRAGPSLFRPTKGAGDAVLGRESPDVLVDILIRHPPLLSRERAPPRTSGLLKSSTIAALGVSQKEACLRQIRLRVFDVISLSGPPESRVRCDWLWPACADLHVHRDAAAMPAAGVRTYFPAEYDEATCPVRARAGEVESGRPGVSFSTTDRVSIDETAGRRAARAPVACLRFHASPTADEEAHASIGRCSSSCRGDATWPRVPRASSESGSRRPPANTLIVEEAQASGWPSLYQIRGRVGRSREARFTAYSAVRTGG